MGALQRDSGAVYAVAAAIFSVYGLVLGLTLAAAWDRYRGAEETLFNEANSIRTLHRTAASLDDTDRDAVQLALLAYGHAVIDGELGQSGEAIVSEEASDALVAIYDLLPETTPPDATTLQVRWQPALGTMYAELGILARARGSRNMIAATGLPAGFWLVLIFGACVSLAAVVLIVPAAQSSQVDDTIYLRLGGGLGHIPSTFPVCFRIPLGVGDHGVDQVERRPAAPAGLNQRSRIQHVSGGQFQQRMTAPGASFQFGKGSPQGPDPVSRLQQLRHQAAAYIPG
jgi:hypothetical protein